MKRSEVNKDPAVALARAKTDARCAMRKLGLLDRLATWQKSPKRAQEVNAPKLLRALCEALEVER